MLFTATKGLPKNRSNKPIRARRARPCLECLEYRIAPAAFTWTGDKSPDWDNIGNWNSGGLNRLPQKGDTVKIPTLTAIVGEPPPSDPVIYAKETAACDSITITGNAVLNIAGKLNVTISMTNNHWVTLDGTGTIQCPTVNNGSSASLISAGGKISGDVINMAGATFNSKGGNTTVTGSFTNSGMLSLNNNPPGSVALTVDKNFTQKFTGTLAVDWDNTNTTINEVKVLGTADLHGILDISTVQVDGPIKPTPIGKNINVLLSNGRATGFFSPPPGTLWTFGGVIYVEENSETGGQGLVYLRSKKPV